MFCGVEYRTIGELTDEIHIALNIDDTAYSINISIK